MQKQLERHRQSSFVMFDVDGDSGIGLDRTFCLAKIAEIGKLGF